MKREHEIAERNRQFELFPGVVYSRVGLSLPPPDKITQEMDIALEVRLGVCETGGPFARGDFALYRQGTRGAHYAKPLAESWGVSASLIQHYAQLAAFFEPSNRLLDLGWRHHWEAMRAAGGASGDRRMARAWLQQAKLHNWSVADMREAITRELTKRGAIQPKKPEPNPYKQLTEADVWCRRNAGVAGALNKEEAAALLNQIAALVRFTDALRLRAEVAA